MIITRSQCSNIKDYKLTVYKQLLDDLNRGKQSSLCLGICNITDVSYRRIPGVFVEIFRRKPKAPYSDVWWFNPDDMTSRIRLVEAAIKELECQ